MRRILVLLAHPRPSASRITVPLARRAAAVDGVEMVDLYAAYPRLDIDVAREQARLTAADVVIFHHPLYWYSTPAILKEWQDLVLEHGWAYGSGGEALRGKLFFCALSAGGSKGSYGPDGSNGLALRTLLSPLERTAALCGMTYLPPFVLYGALRLGDRLEAHADAYVRLLAALRDGALDVAAAQRGATLNELIAEV